MAHLIADFLADSLNSFFHESRAIPFRFGFADFEQEVAKNFCAVRSVIDLGMKFDGVDLTGAVFDSAYGVFRFCRAAESGSQCAHVIAVAVPDIESLPGYF